MERPAPTPAQLRDEAVCLFATLHRAWYAARVAWHRELGADFIVGPQPPHVTRLQHLADRAASRMFRRARATRSDLR